MVKKLSVQTLLETIFCQILIGPPLSIMAMGCFDFCLNGSKLSNLLCSHGLEVNYLSGKSLVTLRGLKQVTIGLNPKALDRTGGQWIKPEDLRP